MLWKRKKDVSSSLQLQVLEIILAKGEWKVSVVDMPKAFSQTVNEKLKSHHETCVVKQKESLAGLLLDIDNETHESHLLDIFTVDTNRNWQSDCYGCCVRLAWWNCKLCSNTDFKPLVMGQTKDLHCLLQEGEGFHGATQRQQQCYVESRHVWK